MRCLHYFCVLLLALPFLPVQKEKRMVIAVGVALDGRGNVLRNTRIVIEGGRIVAIDPKAAPVDYDLRKFTVMPGWIDMHVHLTSGFGKDGKFTSEMAPEEQALLTASNAWLTLQAGFTTIQTMSEAVAVRDAIAKGHLAGPRILTIVQDLRGEGEKSGTPEQLREYVRKQKEAGADLLKIYASGGMTRGSKTLSQEQLDAICGEANKVGLRTHVHAYRDAVAAATQAGCRQIEHGYGASDDDLKSMAERGTFLDPQGGFLFDNYVQNRSHFAGTPFFPKTEAEIEAGYKPLILMNQEFLRRATKIKGLKIVFGADTLAGMHGRNAEEFIYRVRDCGVDPMTALVSANALAAESLGMLDQIGALLPGRQADIIAIDGDPLRDITAVRRVVFVMKGGIVYKHSMPQQQTRIANVSVPSQEVSFSTEDGGVVSADLYGDGNRGVVLVHGGRFTKSSWQPQAWELSKAGYRVLAIDLRGRGKSKAGPAAKPDAQGHRWDVLAAIRYLHRQGVKTVSIVGASMGGGAAAEASIEAQDGEIDRMVLLAHSPIEYPEKIKGRTLFILTRDDANAAGPRLPKIREQFEKAPGPKKLILLEGDAHAQFVFDTAQGPRLLREILQFLYSP